MVNKKRFKAALGVAGMLAMVLALGMVLAGCNTLQSIEVSKEPVRTVFGQGQQPDWSGLAVMAHYKKNSEEVSNSLQVSGYDKGKAGQQTVTVTFTKTTFPSTSKSTTFTVTVVPVVKLTIQQPPAAAVFMQGDDFNPAGLIAFAEFENGAVPGVTVSPAQPELKFLGYNKNAAGTQALTADYYGKQASFNVKMAAFTGIAVKSPPNNTTDYFTGEELDTTGLAITGTWEGVGEKPLDIKQVTLSGFDMSRAGEQKVSVGYQGKTASFSITVAAMQAISVSRPPDQLLYAFGEKLDLAGLTVQGTRAGATSTEQVDASRLKITGYNSNKGGKQTVTVTVGGKNTTFSVTVAPLGDWDGTVSVKNGEEVQKIQVRLTMEEKSWSLSFDNGADACNGTYTLEGVSGTHIALRYTGGNKQIAPDSADILPPTSLKLTGGTLLNGITLTKAR